jgi:predicted DNA-binding transcriptional regulator AlpA
MSEATVVLSERAAADALGISSRTLQRWRRTGEAGLPFVRLGRKRIAYRSADIDSWLAANVVSTTSAARGGDNARATTRG